MPATVIRCWSSRLGCAVLSAVVDGDGASYVLSFSSWSSALRWDLRIRSQGLAMRLGRKVVRAADVEGASALLAASPWRRA